MDEPQATSSAVTWLMGVIGTWVAVSGAALFHLYEKVARLSSAQEDLDRVWVAVNAIRTTMEEDSRKYGEYRQVIAEKMITREELNGYFARISNEIRKSSMQRNGDD